MKAGTVLRLSHQAEQNLFAFEGSSSSVDYGIRDALREVGETEGPETVIVVEVKAVIRRTAKVDS